MLVHLGPAKNKFKCLYELQRAWTIVIVQLGRITLNNLNSLSEFIDSILSRMCDYQLQIFEYLLELIRCDCNTVGTFAKCYCTKHCLLMRCNSEANLNLVYKIAQDDVRVYLLFTFVSTLYENKHSCQNLSDIVFILHLECWIKSQGNQNFCSIKKSRSRRSSHLWVSSTLCLFYQCVAEIFQVDSV